MAIALVNLSGFLAGQGRHEEALRDAEAAWRICELRVPADHRLRATTLTNLAVAKQGLGRHDEAVALAERAVAMQARLYGLADPRTARSRVVLGEIHHAARDLERALAEYRLADDAYRAADPRHPRRADALLGLGKALIDLGRRAEADAPLREALKLREGDTSVRPKELDAIRELLALTRR